MQSAVFETFNGKNTHVSFVGRVSKDRAASFLETALPSPALTKAGADFAAIAADREASKSAGGDVGDRLAAMRALLARSKETNQKLGDQAVGGESLARDKATVGDEGIIALAARMAAEKFGNPIRTAEAVEPSSQFTPAVAKAPKQLS